MKTTTIGGLTVRLLGGTDGGGGGDGPLVVFCHGFGAPGDDLVAIGSMLGLPREVRLAFPAAPLGLPPMFGGGRAWWMIDFARLEQALATGQMRDLRGDEPVGMAEARAQLDGVIEALAGDAKVVLGGFSQGAMIATDLALRTARPLAGLVLFSGTFLAADVWKPKMAARAGLPVYQSHGRLDPLLPFSLAEELAGELGGAGLEVTFEPFDGAHEIPPRVLAGAAAFVQRALG